MKKKTLKNKDKINFNNILNQIDKNVKKNKKLVDLKEIKRLHDKTNKFLDKQTQEYIDRLNSELLKRDVDISKKTIFGEIFENFEGNKKNYPGLYKIINEKKPNTKGEFKCFNEYQMVKELGSGAFGKTYLTKKEDKEYAIKVIDIRYQRYAPDIKQQIENIKNEIEIAKQMGDKKIGPKIYDSYLCKINGKISIYIVMEYMNLGTLFEWLKENKLSKKNESNIKKKIESMHQYVTHQDLHLNNIFVHKENGHIKFFIGDFGLSNTFKNLIENSKKMDIKRIDDAIKYQIKNKNNEIISKLFVIFGFI